MKVANIKHFFDRYHKLITPTLPHWRQLKQAADLARQEGYAFGTDGRAYVPENRRGKGVGYGAHGHGTTS